MMNVQTKTKSSVSPLRLLHDHGQTVWPDFLSRRFIEEDGRKKLIERDGSPALRVHLGSHVAAGLTILKAVRQALA